MVRRPIVLLVVSALSLAIALPSRAAPPQSGSPGTEEAKNSSKKTESKASAENDEYFELYQALADTIDQVDRNYVKEVSRRELVEAAIRGVVNRLDPYSTYISPAELNQFRTSVENEFGGIGIQVSADDGDLKVLSPIYGAPAYKAGVLAGDRIVEIDGKPTENLQQDEAVSRMQGKEGSSVTLTIVHAGLAKPEKVTLKREMVHVETVLGDRRKDDDTWNFMLDDTPHIGYIRISTFSRDTAAELRQALLELKEQHAKALIVDLRFNPGGLLTSAIEICNLFISQGRIVSTKGRNTPEKVYDAQGSAIFGDVPMAILVNRYSASASEIVSACLQDHKRATIIGERTWGKGSVQNIIDLENGKSALKLTTAAYRRPSGKNIHRFPDSKPKDEWGVMPNDGYDLAFTDSEARQFLNDRRDRDILLPHRHSAKSDKVAAKQGTAPMPNKREGTSEPDAAKPTGGNDGSDNRPVRSTPSSTSNERPKSLMHSEFCFEDTLAKVPAVKQRGDNGQEAKKTGFVDRQLALAVKFLKEQIAKDK